MNITSATVRELPSREGQRAREDDILLQGVQKNFIVGFASTCEYIIINVT
jgi:hypothetical protein